MRDTIKSKAIYPFASTMLAFTVASGVMTPMTAEASNSPSSSISSDIKAVLELSHTFDLEGDRQVQVAAADHIDLGYGLTVVLPQDLDGSAVTDGSVTWQGETVDGTGVVTAASSDGAGFALVVTEYDDSVETRYEVELMAGTTLISQPDGGLTHVDVATGRILNSIAPAWAMDSSGVYHQALYEFDPVDSQLVVTADTSDATGAVLIDPWGWRCARAVLSLGLWPLSGAVASLAGAPTLGAFLIAQGVAAWRTYAVVRACQ